jgi:8-oxo-dGTP diphosphatase
MVQRTYRIGVGVLVWRDTTILVGRRRGSYGAGTWALPGGMLEHGEQPEETAARELREETGLVATNFRIVDAHPWVEREDGYNIVVACDYVSGEPELRESEKCDGWVWHRVETIPHPRFPELARHLERAGHYRD